MITNFRDPFREETPLTPIKGLRYLFRDAVGDFIDAVKIGRKRLNNEITPEEFSAAMSRRFPVDTPAAR